MILKIANHIECTQRALVLAYLDYTCHICPTIESSHILWYRYEPIQKPIIDLLFLSAHSQKALVTGIPMQVVFEIRLVANCFAYQYMKQDPCPH